jgi:hypothetical protein
VAAHAIVGVGATAALTFRATSTTRPSARRTFAIKKLAHLNLLLLVAWLN